MKKITGLCITTGGVIRVPNSKHFETKIQYDYLTSIILKLNNMNDYFAFYNLERDRVYLISIKEEGLPKNEVTIRFCLPKTKNQFKTFLEEDYLIDKVIQ